MPFPVHDATTPFWRTELGDMDNHRTTEQLPTEADIVIIGAGFAGASIAHHLLEKGRNRKSKLRVVMLEARQACSGATGRNGGHLRPDPYGRVSAVYRKYGKEAADEVASFEARHIKEIQDLVEKDKIDCDFELTRAMDVCLYEQGRNRLVANLENLKAAGISTVKNDVLYSNEDTAEVVSGVKAAKGCFASTAAHLWPYKLVAHLLDKAVSEGVNLQTHTPARSVSPLNCGSEENWLVQTDRGSVQTGKVVYASNAYTSALLPEFEKAIIPVKGMCCHIVSSARHPPLLSGSYALRFNDWEYDYLMQRKDGSIIVGGGRKEYIRDLSTWYDVADDSTLIEPAKTYFDDYMQRHFSGLEDSNAHTEEIWTGIMGYSSDNFPHVGPVPGKKGQFICAGFSGHGMPQIFLSAKAVSSMLVENMKPEDADLPRLYRTSQERLERTTNVILDSWKTIPDLPVSK